MDDAVASEQAAKYACMNCEDTRRVRVKFTGAAGDFTREVACPACGPDVTVTTPDSRADSAEAAFVEKRLSLIAALAVLAAIVAAIAYMKATSGNPFAEAVREAAE